MKIIFLTIILAIFTPFLALASSNINLAITPPLIELNMSPGEEMSTAIKVVNNGKTKIPLSVNIRDFENDKNNKIKFLQNNKSDISFQDKDKSLLSQWITIQSKDIVIPPFQSRKVIFNIKVPLTAGPGGHYAAILVGDNTPGKKNGTTVSISSYLSSLILLNIKGDVTEEGEIRDFSTDKFFYNNPEVKFSLSFKNRGNVHLHPEGGIKIYDFWNNNVGNIDINKNTSFGNVLPDSTKKWNFTWSQEKNIFKMGKYTAKLALVFGSNKKSDYREVNFWIIDLRLLLIFLVS